MSLGSDHAAMPAAATSPSTRSRRVACARNEDAATLICCLAQTVIAAPSGSPACPRDDHEVAGGEAGGDSTSAVGEMPTVTAAPRLLPGGDEQRSPRLRGRRRHGTRARAGARLGLDLHLHRRAEGEAGRRAGEGEPHGGSGGAGVDRQRTRATRRASASLPLRSRADAPSTTRIMSPSDTSATTSIRLDR